MAVDLSGNNRHSVGDILPTGGTRYEGSQKVTEGTAAPSSGSWSRGDRCWNTTPSAAGAPGWICVTAGTPGTWKPMADLGA